MDSNILMQQVQADGTLLGLLPQSKASNISIDTVPGVTGDDVQEALTQIGTTLNSHVNDLNNPHHVTTSQIGAATATGLNAHISNTNNPHQVTASQIEAYSIYGGDIYGQVNSLNTITSNTNITAPYYKVNGSTSGNGCSIQFKPNNQSASASTILATSTKLSINCPSQIDLNTNNLTLKGQPFGGGGGDIKIFGSGNSDTANTTDNVFSGYTGLTYNTLGGSFASGTGIYTMPSDVTTVLLLVDFAVSLRSNACMLGINANGSPIYQSSFQNKTTSGFTNYTMAHVLTNVSGKALQLYPLLNSNDACTVFTWIMIGIN